MLCVTTATPQPRNTNLILKNCLYAQIKNKFFFNIFSFIKLNALCSEVINIIVCLLNCCWLFFYQKSLKGNLFYIFSPENWRKNTNNFWIRGFDHVYNIIYERTFTNFQTANHLKMKMSRSAFLLLLFFQKWRILKVKKQQINISNVMCYHQRNINAVKVIDVRHYS